MKKNLVHFEHHKATVEFGLVTILCLWLGNESSFVVPDDVTKQRFFTKPQTSP